MCFFVSETPLARWDFPPLSMFKPIPIKCRILWEILFLDGTIVWSCDVSVFSDVAINNMQQFTAKGCPALVTVELFVFGEGTNQ